MNLIKHLAVSSLRSLATLKPTDKFYNRHQNTTYIISGPSCAGKSTIVQNEKIYSFTKPSSNYPIVFPPTIWKNYKTIKSGCFFHYNLLRIADQSYRTPDNSIKSLYDFMSDPPWLEMSRLTVPKRALILVSSRATLEKRMISRLNDEPRNLTGISPTQYLGNHWIEVLNTVNLYELYSTWCKDLMRLGIKYTLINSENENYEIIQEEQLKNFCQI